jgi:ABC-2 type transport system permease protein
MFRRLREMLIKEFLQVLRDARMRGMVLGMPVIQMVIIAFALTTDVTNVRMAVLDEDGSPASRELIASFTSSGHFRIVEALTSPAEIDALLDQSRARVLVRVAAGFGGDIAAGRTAHVQVLADATDSNTAAIVLGYSDQIVNQFGASRIAQRLGQLGLQDSPVTADVTFETRARFNPNLESRFYYVPGLIAIMLLVVGMMIASLAIVREKEAGTIEQVMVTPIGRFEFIVGKTLPFLLIGYFIMTIMFIIAMAVFGIRVRGSWLLLYGLTGVYLAGNLGLALFISAGAATQQQAVLTAFFIMMPAVLLSGLMFPIYNMPQVVRYATMLNPMRWYIEILRGIVEKGLGLSALWPAALAQCALAVGFLVLASVRFHKTLA